MSKYFFLIFFSLSTIFGFSQEKSKETNERKSLLKTEEQKAKEKARIAPHTSYKIITLERDTTYVDTSLNIKSDYKYNYLKKDMFGLLPFANEGQTYNSLNYTLTDFSALPKFGFKAKHFNYLDVNDINYYSVATPLTELYFKTVMEQGQSVDAFITLNTSERFNFSIAYKGLRSLGKYINQLSSNGNFRFTTSYFTKDKKYAINMHFTGQDLLNGENGGITTLDDFESENTAFDNRARFQVYFTDAKSFLKGKRYFVDHQFRINAKNTSNNIFINHQFNYETKYFQFDQSLLTTTIGTDLIKRLGDSYVTSNISDRTKYRKIYNNIGVAYENSTIGKVKFFVENFYNASIFDRIIVLESAVIPNLLKQNVNAIGGQYEYQKNKWKGNFTYNKALSKETFSSIDASLRYKLDEKNNFEFQYQNISKIPDNNYSLNQSSYLNYNWNNDFSNEKINNIKIIANTKWVNTEAQFTVLDDHLYFTNKDLTNILQLVTPKQYNKTINYLSFKLSKEITYYKFSLDNTFLIQNVAQEDKILNVPQLVTRNTLYFTNHFFNKALYLQTGVTVNYFTKYFADDYNPLLSEFFVQTKTEIGNFPMLDFFINGRIRQARVFLKAEHFNSGFTGNKFYSATNYPYRDFMIRFGLVWNFFQ